MAVNMLKKDAKTETFQQKADAMGLSLQQQADMLNKLYTGKMQFRVLGKGINIDVIDSNIEMLELPEVRSLNFDNIYVPWGSKMYGIKFPKCMPKTKARELQLYNYERVFAWDDNITDLNLFRENFDNCKLKMIAMQYSDGRKPKIYRFN